MKRRYKLLFGRHICDIDGKEVTFEPGSVIETEQNLLLNNGINLSPKFELVDDGAAKESDLLERVRQLEAELAAEREAKELV